MYPYLSTTQSGIIDRAVAHSVAMRVQVGGRPCIYAQNDSCISESRLACVRHMWALNANASPFVSSLFVNKILKASASTYFSRVCIFVQVLSCSTASHTQLDRMVRVVTGLVVRGREHGTCLHSRCIRYSWCQRYKLKIGLLWIDVPVAEKSRLVGNWGRLI